MTETTAMPFKHIAERLDKSAERQLQEIINHGPRNFEEWLIKAESQTCSICKLKTAKGCPLESLVREHPVYKDWDFCVKCGGRQVAKDDEGNPVYGDSKPVMVVSGKGHMVVTRCDCEAAEKTCKNWPPAPEPFMSMCENQRWFAAKTAERRVLASKKQNPC